MSIKKAQERIKTAEKELALAQELLRNACKPEVTYSIGDRFLRNEDDKHVLIRLRSSEVISVSITDGRAYRGAEAVKDCCRITEAELEKILNLHCFARYWDDRKKEYTDGREVE